jgi:hypothetical protein
MDLPSTNNEAIMDDLTVATTPAMDEEDQLMRQHRLLIRESEKLFQLCKSDATLDMIKFRLSQQPQEWKLITKKHVLGVIRSKRVEATKIAICTMLLNQPYPIVDDGNTEEAGNEDDSDERLELHLCAELDLPDLFMLFSSQK